MVKNPPLNGGFSTILTEDEGVKHLLAQPYERSLTARIDVALADTPAVLLSGARQVGKSTLARTRVRGECYVTLDTFTEREGASTDPEGFLSGLGCDTRLVIDEIQRVPALLLAIKASIDRDRRPGRFLLTGSADVLMLPQVSETLAGRMELFTLYPLARCEINRRPSLLADFLEGELPEIRTTTVTRSELLEDARAGGYPEARTRKSGGRRDSWFSSYLSTMIAREAREILQLGNDDAMLRLLRFVALRSMGPRNIDAMAHDSGIAATTVRRYLDVLRTIYVIDAVPAWFINAEKRLTKQPKLLLVDSGLHAYLLGDSADAGALLETYVGCELQRLCGMQSDTLRMYHYRTARGAEVDWLLEDRNGRIIGCEVKAAASVSQSDFRGLYDLADAAKERFRWGIVFYTGDRIVQFGKQFVAVPIALL